MKDLAVYFKGYLKETLLGPLFKLLEAGFELWVPLLIAQLVDQIIPDKNQTSLVLMIFWLAVLAVLGVGVAVLAQYFSAKAAVRYIQALTQDLFDKVLRLPKRSRDQVGVSSLISRLSSDTYQIQTGINLFLRLFLRAPIVVLGALVMAFVISPRLSLSFLVMVAVLALVFWGLSRLAAPLYQSQRQRLDAIVSLAREQLTGMRVIRAFDQTGREETTFRETNRSNVHQQLAAGRWTALAAPLTFFIVNTTLVTIIWQGNGAVASGQISQGLLLALVNYLLQVSTELLKAAVLVTGLNQAYVSARRIQAVFALEEEDLEASLPQQQIDGNQVLVIDDLTYAYADTGQPVLSEISLSLEAGNFLGIIGGTGAGKSSLVNLLLGLDQPQSGSLQLYQQGRSPETPREWRNWVALVPQQAQLFKGSIRSNLLLGQQRAVTDAELWQALRLAQAEDFVREKGGLDAAVAGFGRNFSGGQRQRLTIARAFLKQAPVLILDDATSALDYLTEARLLAAVRQHFRDRTLIVVSQRTRSLLGADQILLLEKGRQLGLDSHSGLLAGNSVYQAIHQSQQSGGEVHA